MKDAVLIKSYQSGITLLMREDASLEEILQELAVKFTEAKTSSVRPPWHYPWRDGR